MFLRQYTSTYVGAGKKKPKFGKRSRMTHHMSSIKTKKKNICILIY